MYTVQGSRNSRVSLRPSVCPVDQYLPLAAARARAAYIDR